MSDNVFSRLVDQEVTAVGADGTPLRWSGRGLQDRVVRRAIGNLAADGFTNWSAISQAIRALDPDFKAWSVNRIRGYGSAVARNQQRRAAGEAEEVNWLDGSFNDDAIQAGQYLARRAREIARGGAVDESEPAA